MQKKMNMKRCVEPNIILLGACIVYAITTTLIFTSFGLIENIDEIMFSTIDAQGYLEITEYILGEQTAISNELVTIRSFLFPLFLSTHKVIGVSG